MKSRFAAGLRLRVGDLGQPALRRNQLKPLAEARRQAPCGRCRSRVDFLDHGRLGRDFLFRPAATGRSRSDRNHDTERQRTAQVFHRQPSRFAQS